MFFEDFKVGMRFELPPVTIRKEKMMAFARDYDPLALHLDEEYAAGTRFKGIIAPGLMSFMSVWHAFALEHDWRDTLVAGKSLKMDFLAPVYPNDVLSGEALVTDKKGVKRYTGDVELSFNVFNQDNVQTIRAVDLIVFKVKKTSVT